MMHWNHPTMKRPAWFGTLLLFLLAGCGTLQNGRRWGEDVTLRPGWDKFGRAAVEAVTSPAFYIPTATALLLQIEHADRRISDWAREHTPVYGCNSRAEEWSNDLRSLTAYTMYASMLATPSGNEPIPWGTAKVKGALIQYGAVGISHVLISGLKDVSGRERPNGFDDRSFPAGKTPSGVAFATIASRNIATLDVPRPAKITFNVGLCATLTALGWSQIEAGSHYPADVLAGVALAYFITAFLNDAFMGLDAPPQAMPVAGYDGSALFLGYCWRF